MIIRFPNKWTKLAIKFALEKIEDKKHTGILTKLGCQRFLEDLESGQWDYDADAVAETCEYFEKLPPPSGEQFGKYLKLMPWQIFLFANVDGFRIKRDIETPPAGMRPRRRFTQIGLWTGRKSGKTATGASLLLKDLTVDQRFNSRQITAASTKDQASHVLDAAVSIVKRSPELRRMFNLRANSYSVVRNDEHGGHLHSISGNPKALDGHRPTAMVLDEIHALQNWDLFNVMLTAFGTSYSWILFMPSTAGHNIDSVGRTQFDLQTELLNRRITLDDVFSQMFVPDKDDDPYDQTTWYKANPSLGVTVPLSFYETQAGIAKKSKENESFFITRQCNIWRGSTAEQWIQEEDWDACKSDRFSAEIIKGTPCYVGLDASAIDDLTAICKLFVLPGELLYAEYEIYCPKQTILNKANSGKRVYDVWEQMGHIIPCGETRIDNEFIAKRITQLDAQYMPRWFIVDQYAGTSQIASHIPYETRKKLRRLRKTAASVTESCRDFEARIVAHNGFRHDGNPVARWCALNTYVRRFVDESLIPQKESESSDKKIDATDALIFANSGRLTAVIGHDVEPLSRGEPPKVLFI